MFKELPVKEWGKFLGQYLNKKSKKRNKFLKSISFHPKKLENKKIEIRPSTTDIEILIDLLAFERYLPETKLNHPSLIFDLGANIGITTAHLSLLYPSAKVIGVELEKNNYQIAKKNTAFAGDRIEMIQAGVWIKDGIVGIQGEKSDGFSIRESGEGLETVSSITIETLSKRFRPAKIDFIKMDIEGAEENIFLGAEPFWLSGVNQVLIEIHDYKIKKSIIKKIVEFGFEVSETRKHWSGLAAHRIAAC